MITEAVAESGWTALELLSHDEVAAVLAACGELLALPPGERKSRDKPVAGTRHLFSLDERSPVIAELVERPVLIDAVTAFLGPRYERVETSYRCPQPNHGQQRLHADDVPKLGGGPDVVATAIVALTDFDQRNGATRLVPGSHRRVDLQRRSGALASHPDEIVLTGLAGTAFVFSGHILHSGTTNRSTSDRPALQLVWRVGGP